MECLESLVTPQDRMKTPLSYTLSEVGNDSWPGVRFWSGPPWPKQ